MEEHSPATRIVSPVDRNGTPYQSLQSPETPPAVSRPFQSAYSRARASPLSATEGIPDHEEQTAGGEPSAAVPVPPASLTNSSPYTTPTAPAPPLFPEPTAYDPAANLSQTLSPSTSGRPSRTRSLLSRIGTLRSSKSTRRQRYGALQDDEQAILHGAGGQTQLKGLQEEEEDDEEIGFDVTAFEGPIALQNMPARKVSQNTNARNFAEADLAAEYERLESHTRGNESIGFGMGTVVEAPFLSTTHGADSLSRATSDTTANARDVAQRAAEESGEILVLKDRPTIDIEHLGGQGYGSQVDLSVPNAVAQGGPKQSYYFPPDPDMPNWRPFSMHWAYILFLTILAFSLAGVQEFLCQLSQRLAKDNRGLLEFTSPTEVSMTAYFTWKYAPIIGLLSYGILWQVTDFEVKRLEPFYQLSKKSGATAAESLNMDYLTFMSYLTPFKAIRHKQLAVVYSSSATLLAGGLVPILQSASVTLHPDKAKRKEDEPKFVRIDAGWSRAMTAALICVALCGVLLLFQLRRKSGLLSDPKGIAGIAAMATRSHILNDFRGLDTAPHHVIHKQLKHRRYILHKSSLWQGEYIRHAPDDKMTRSVENPHPIMLNLKAGIPYIASMLIFAALIPVFVFIPGANHVTETLPFLLTALATAIKLLWNTLDCDVRMIQPFYTLSRRHAPPRTLTLDYTGTVPGWICIKAALNRHFVVALVGFGSIMVEVLTVCVSSFSVDGRSFLAGPDRRPVDDPAEDRPDDHINSGETFKSFWVSLSLSEGILVSLCALAGMVYLRRRQPFLPRQPGTIASVLAFIHQSKMLLDFVETERLDSRAMTAHLERLGKTYGLGWFGGRDGEDHCGVEQEELISGYQHGVDWSEGRLRKVASDWEHY